jgi:hypothetical protein
VKSIFDDVSFSAKQMSERIKAIAFTYLAFISFVRLSHHKTHLMGFDILACGCGNIQ